MIFGSGGGGPYLLMENLREVADHRCAHRLAVLHRQHAARHGIGPDRDRDRHPRLEHVHRHGLLNGHAQHRRGGRGHPPRRLHRRDLTGATENPLHEMVYIGFSNMRGMGMPRPGESIETVSRPFDKTRDGFVLGEGSGAMMLEDLEFAKARGAKVYAEVVGYGSAADAWDLIQPVDKGDGARRAMLQALERHNVPANEVDLINPHGTSTPLGDLREAQAIWGAFGEHTPNIAISATKSMTGHLMGAAGAIEGVFTVLSVYNQCAPQTLNYRDDDPEINLNVVKDARGRWRSATR